MPRKQAAKKTSPKKRAGGRPSKYQHAFAEQARKLCLLGATDAQLADFFEVNEDTINAWKKAHAKFSESLKAGKLEADSRVAESLYQRALGYSHKAVKIFADPKSGKQKIVKYVEQYPPDTVACIFWLKNRQKEHWRDKHEMEHGATDSFASLIAQAVGAGDV